MWSSFSRRSRSVPPLHKAARPETRDCVSRCSVALHTARHRLAERNRFAPCYVGPAEGRRLVPELDCQCKLPCTVLPRFSRIKTGACRGLRPCLLCHLCPATATAIAVAASGPKQHRLSDERPLQPRCRHQRHHPPEGRCWGYIYLFFGRSRAAARLLFELLVKLESEAGKAIRIVMVLNLIVAEIFFN